LRSFTMSRGRATSPRARRSSSSTMT
jgi:hypothetical protein